MRNQKTRLLILALLTATILAACAPAPAATTEGADETQAPEATEAMSDETQEAAATDAATEAAGDEVVINWWHINTQEKEMANWQAIADAYMAEHPNVKIEITVLANEDFKTRLNTAMQAGDPPDLFQSWGGGVLYQYADAGLLRDITPELDGEWRDTFAAQSALDLYCNDAGCYGVPWQWGAVGFFYNKSLFEQAGLDPDNPPATWSEFVDAVTALKAAGITPIALGEKEEWPGAFWYEYLAIREGGQSAFEAAYSREGSFTDEPFITAGQDLVDLVAMEPFPDGFEGLTYGDEASVMGNGLAAMELMGQWSPSVQMGSSENGEGIGDDLGWFPFPVVEGGAGDPSDVLGGGDGFAIGVNAPAETVDFLRFLTSVENQRKMVTDGIISTPVVKGTEDLITDPVASAIIEARNNAKYFQLYYDQFMPATVGKAVNDAAALIFNNAGSPQDAAQMIDDAAALELDAQ